MKETEDSTDIRLFAIPILPKKLYYDDFYEVKKNGKSRACSTPYANKRKRNNKQQKNGKY